MKQQAVITHPIKNHEHIPDNDSWIYYVDQTEIGEQKLVEVHFQCFKGYVTW